MAVLSNQEATLTPGESTILFVAASEVKLRILQTIGSATILATAPAGVGSLDIVYEVRTRADA